jgi:xylulokinase
VTRTIGIDLGTSGIKAVLMDDGARVLGTSAQPIAVSIPQVGWSEQDPDAWVATVFACLDDLAARHPEAMASVQGIGLSGQMLACLILDHAHRPLRPAMLWNDQRAVAECADLLERVPDIGRRSNGTPDPGITAPKLLWLRRHRSGPTPTLPSARGGRNPWSASASLPAPEPAARAGGATGVSAR